MGLTEKIKNFENEFSFEIMKHFEKIWPYYKKQGYTEQRLIESILNAAVEEMSKCDNNYKWSYSLSGSFKEDGFKVDFIKEKRIEKEK